MPALYLSTGKTAGEECSSTYEGRHITLEESYLIHPYHADGFVDKGDPVLFAIGSDSPVGVGVAFNSAAAATDYIAIDTEGIWFLNVLGAVSDATIDGMARALKAGDPVYINRTAGTVGAPYMLSGMDDPHNYVPFGYLLGDVTASLTVPTLVAVKVHWHPNYLESINAGAFGDNLEIDIAEQVAGGQNNPGWLRAFIKPANIMTAGATLIGINARLEDTLASTGGTLVGAQFQVVVNKADCGLDDMRALNLNMANTLATGLNFCCALAISMGGAGTAPAVQTVFQVMGSGTMGTLQSWFQTEIARGAGLKANVAAVGNTTHEIPINIDGVIYCIPVIAWA